MKWLERIRIYFCCQSKCSLNENDEEQRKRYKNEEYSNSYKKEIS